jgi:hypothetical protein
MRDFPKLSWLNAKCFPQQNGGRKNNPGRKDEHKDAIIENLRQTAKEIGYETPRLSEN